MTGHSFFVLIQKWHKLCFENSSYKLLLFKLNKLILGMADMRPPENSIMYHGLYHGVAKGTVNP